MARREAESILESLDVALYAFALMPPSPDESESAGAYRDLMLARTSREGLRRSADRDAMIAAHRLRVALHLAPRQAIDYASSNPMARWKIVHTHLLSNYPSTSTELLAQLARRVAETLADWQQPRGATVSHRRAVWAKSGGICSACRYDFVAKSSRALAALDPYKPYFLSPQELTAEEVDHVVAISGVGTNDISNLQLLCRWCNFGKSDGLGVDVRKEAEYAALPLSDIPRAHIASMFYMTLAGSAFLCDRCDDNTRRELTVRPLDDRRGFILSNLICICYECADGYAPIC